MGVIKGIRITFRAMRMFNTKYTPYKQYKYTPYPFLILYFMLGTAYFSPSTPIITMIELISETIKNTKVRLILAVSFPKSVVPLSMTFPPTPPLFHTTDGQSRAHSNQHIEHRRYASTLFSSPTSKHTSNRHLRIALNCETHISYNIPE